MPKKFYAIKKGKKTGVFTGNWKKIEGKYIKGFSNPQFKGFDTIEGAENYLSTNKSSNKNKRKENIRKEQLEKEAINKVKIEAKQQAKAAFELERKKTQSIIYDPNNKNNKDLRKIKLVISCHHDHIGGFYRSLLIDEKTNKFIKINQSPHYLNTSSNRAIIIGIIEEISKLKVPSHVKIHSKTNFGYQIMIKGKKSINKDKLLELKDLLYSNGHIIEENIEDEIVMREYFTNYK